MPLCSRSFCRTTHEIFCIYGWPLTVLFPSRAGQCGLHSPSSPIYAASLAQRTGIRLFLWDSHSAGQWSYTVKTAAPLGPGHSRSSNDCPLKNKQAQQWGNNLARYCDNGFGSDASRFKSLLYHLLFLPHLVSVLRPFLCKVKLTIPLLQEDCEDEGDYLSPAPGTVYKLNSGSRLLLWTQPRNQGNCLGGKQRMFPMWG